MSWAASPIPPLRPGITLYLVRHGETDWNREARYQGQQDIPLNERGRRQAQRNGAALANVNIDVANAAFIASPLSRAVETMQHVRRGLGLPADGFAIDDRLKELHYGSWEGQLQRRLTETDPHGVAAKAKDPFNWRPEGGESYADLQERITGWLQTLTQSTIAVSHGGVSRVARGAVLGLETRSVPFLDCPQDKVLVLTADGMRWL